MDAVVLVPNVGSPYIGVINTPMNLVTSKLPVETFTSSGGNY